MPYGNKAISMLDLSRRPAVEGLADQQRRRKISEEDSKRDEQERAKNHEFWAWKARNLSAWAPRGMG